MRSGIAVFALLIAALVLAGCQSPQSPPAQPTSPDDMMLITFYGPVDSPGIPFTMRACIVRTNRIDPGSTMKVRVLGQVTRPGLLEVKKGATLLDAIEIAGGFVPMAFPQKVKVKRNDKIYSLRLNYKKAQEPDCYRAWYGDEKSPGDFVLESDDMVIVPAVL
jgi:hypothetical protein